MGVFRTLPAAASPLPVLIGMLNAPHGPSLREHDELIRRSA
jgi:hypothetical protein